MHAPYRRARYIPQVPDDEMISPIPAHGSYFRHSVDGDNGDFHSSQSVQDAHIYTKEFSVGSYQTLPLENGSGNSTCSSDLRSNSSLSETGFNIGLLDLMAISTAFLTSREVQILRCHRRSHHGFKRSLQGLGDPFSHWATPTGLGHPCNTKSSFGDQFCWFC